MITTVTLNASIDKAYYLEQGLRYGEVMRVARFRNSAGGKGINVAKIIQLCKEQVLATGFVGGFNGRYLEFLLQQEQIAYQFISVEGETRNCINVLDQKYGSTEFLEPGLTVTKEKEAEFLTEFETMIRGSEVVTISGSAPSGMSTMIYHDMVQMVKKQHRRVILDASGELLKNALASKPTMVKPNKDELELLFQTKLRTVDQIIDCGENLYDMGIPYVVISLGKKGAMLICKEGIFRAITPNISAVNTVGCGDSMVGAFAVAMIRGYSSEQALTFAASIATASALSEITGHFKYSEYKKIEKQVQVEKLRKRGRLWH